MAAQRTRLLHLALASLHQVGKLSVSDLYSRQRGWLGDDHRARMLVDFRAEAIARLPPPERAPYLDALVAEVGATPAG